MVFDYHLSVVVGLIVKLADPLFIIKKIVIGIKCLRNFTIRFLCGKVKEVKPKKGVPSVN